MEKVNIDSWKHQMKKFADRYNLDIQEVYQRFILEEFAQMISHSDYKEKLIIKGGFVVSTLLGFETRMTRDIDITYNSIIYDESEITKIIIDITKVDYNTIFSYSISNIEKSQEDDDYSGYVITLSAEREATRFYLKLDVSNNSLIHPQAIESQLKSLFSNSNIDLYTYHIENIIAEKFETTLDRGEFNGRIRDLFDIYFLMTECSRMIDDKILRDSIIKVSEDRGTMSNLKEYENIKNELLQSKIFNQNFNKYKSLQYPHHEIQVEDIFLLFDSIHALVDNNDN